jgi:hypothetical protein
VISEEGLAEYFSNFTSSAFRLETLDTYLVDSEADYFERFLAGGDLPDDWKENPWVRGITEGGRKLQRVHVLSSPLTEYLKFELGWGYPGNVKDGEDIRILDTADTDAPELPDHDFWLFDEKIVLRMHYTDNGEFLGAEELTGEHAVDYVLYRHKALRAAVPYTEYWSRYR